MSQHKDQLSVQGPGAELQAAQDTSLSVCAGVSSVTQNEQITGESIEECLQRTAGIRAAHDGRVGRLTFGCQSLAHAVMHLASSRSTHHEALVSLFQGLQGQPSTKGQDQPQTQILKIITNDHESYAKEV